MSCTYNKIAIKLHGNSDVFLKPICAIFSVLIKAATSKKLAAGCVEAMQCSHID